MLSITNSLLDIMPLQIVMITGMLVLILDSCIPAWRRAKVLSPGLSLCGISLAFLSTIHLLNNPPIGKLFGGAISADPFSQACSIILLIIAALAILLAMTYLENMELNHGEYYCLVLFSTFGAMIMASALELIVLFIGVEILSVALYVLAGFARTKVRSEEAALKYFLLGAFAAGFLLYGIALIYGGSGFVGLNPTTNLATLGSSLNMISAPPVMMIIGLGLLLVGLGFKAGLVPFHMWTPDVYEGAPTSVTAYMAAAAKIGAFAALLRVLNAFIPISSYWLIVIQVIAVLTMFGGNIIAITQDNVKRMLAYSSIAHAGYLLVAVAAACNTGSRLTTLQQAAAHSSAFGAAMFYLLAYSLTTIGAFGVLIWLSKRGRDIQTLNDLKGLARTDPAAAYTMLIFMLSLGGIPPTMGFMGKWFIFNATMQSGQTWLALCLGVASIISVYYYLRVVWVMCFQEPEEGTSPGRAESANGVQTSIYFAVGTTLLFGVLPNLIQPLMDAASSLLRP